MSNNVFNGVFVGTVVDNKDPKQIGRIRVTVPSVYGNIKLDDLPWAEPCFPYAYNDRGIFFIPEVGSLVVIQFINGSPYKAIWMGAIHREEDNIVPQEVKSDYPNVKEIKTKVGYLKFDDTNMNIEIKHKNGSVITLNRDGDVVIQAVRDIVLLSGRNIELNPSAPNITPLPEYKSQNELARMSIEQVNEYNNKMLDNELATTGGDCTGGEEQYQGGKGAECRSQDGSKMRIWAKGQRVRYSIAQRQQHKTTLRQLNGHNKTKSGVNLTFADFFATRIENALDELQKKEPKLYSSFLFVDGLRPMDANYGSSTSYHKYGLAFDFRYTAFDCEDREKVYYIFGKHGICCPLPPYNGKDEGMHMEPSASFYSGPDPIPKSDVVSV